MSHYLVPVLLTLCGAALHAAEGHDEHHHEHGAHAEHAEHAEHSDAVTLAAAVATRFGIVSEPAKTRALAALVLAPGWITYNPAGQAQIATPAAGRVLAVHVQPGGVVKAGDALIDILSPAFVEAQNAYVLKRAALTAAVHHLTTTTETLARGRQAGDGISGAELKRREAEFRQAEVERVMAEAELTAALSTVRLLGPTTADLDALTTTGTVAQNLVLRAPLAGTVISCTALPGQQVAGDAPPLLTIADPARLWVIANIPETQVGKVTVGSLAELYAFNGDRLADGDIEAVTPDIDPHTRSGWARLSITGSQAIRSGMYVQVRVTPLEAEAGPRVIAVPEGAVMTHEGHAVVFIAEPAGDDIRFRAQPVMTGPTMGGFLPILKGLDEGAQVVVQGAFLLKADLGKEGAAHEH